MKSAGSNNQSQLIEVAFLSILFVVFFQLLVDYIEGVYAFGLLGTGIPMEIISVLLFLSPFLMIFFPRGLGRSGFLLIAWTMALSRPVEVMLPTRARMFVAGLGIACFLVLFPSLLWDQSRKARKISILTIGLGFTLAISLLIFFRVVNSSLDITTDGALRWLGWGMALLLGALSIFIFRDARQESGESPGSGSEVSTSRLTGLALGIIATLTIIYFGFFAPNVIARWSGGDYLLIITVLMLSLIGFGSILALRPGWLLGLPPFIVWLWNLLFVSALMGLLYLHQISFPPDPRVYPIYETAIPWWNTGLLLIVLILFPVVPLDFLFFYQEILKSELQYRKLGSAFGVASLFLLFLILSQVFTTTYDYIPVIGPVFRDRFWAVYLTVGIVMVLPLSLVREGWGTSVRRPDRLIALVTGFGMLVVIGILTITFGYLLSPHQVAVKDPATKLKVLTYNIQQGYSESGLKNYDGQLEMIQAIDADIIGLQESDTNRIANGNTDIVRYFADRLDLYSYFGPKTVTGTFGIALLSKYPIENPRTFYMFSEGEQTATIEAQVRVGEQTFNIYITHLGNGGPIVQQQQILQVVRNKQNVVLIGDFNFRPDTGQYETTTEILEDAWIVRWPGGNSDQGVDPMDRIDHTFLTPGIRVEESEYITYPASDHPAMWTLIRW